MKNLKKNENIDMAAETKKNSIETGFIDLMKSNPLSKSSEAKDGKYYAALSHVDQDPVSGKWEAVFEMAPKDWVDKVVFVDERFKKAASFNMPYAPTATLRVRDVTEEQLRTYLGADKNNSLENYEGIWFLIEETKENTIAPTEFTGDIVFED